MRKKLTIFMILTLITALGLGGCGSKKETVQPPPDTSNQNQREPEEESQEKEQLETETDGESRTATGTYIGQIDSHSVEIEVSGYPQAASARAFQLSDELKERWDSLVLKEGDKVTIKFFTREQENPVLLDIAK